MQDNVKLEIKFGQLEMNYEGPLQFIEDGLAELCGQISGLEIPTSTSNEGSEVSSNHSMQVASDNSLSGMSMNALAQKYGVKKGADLFKVAAIHLDLVQGRTTFQRSDILTEIKNANSYYKNSTHGNHSGSIFKNLLTEDFLREQNGDNFSISAEAIALAKSRLGIDQ